METVTSADGTPIAFERTGQGPPLVLVHGTTADHTRWEPVAPAFEEQFTVYAIDRRGRGMSGDAQQTVAAVPTRIEGSDDTAEYDLMREVEDVVAMVDAIDEPVILFGHSYGAICSLEAALRTDNLRGLILYEPPLPVGDAERDTEDILAEITGFYENGENEHALVLFLRDIAGIPPAELDALRAAPNWPARVEAVHTVIREERARKAYEFDASQFAEMATPTVLLLGTETATLHTVASNALDEVLRDSRIARLDGQAHAAMNTAPDLVIEEVLAFGDELGNE